jgi:formamidopyrimidine-DNA glycosylase
LDKLVSRRKIALAELVRERLAPETGPVEFAAGLKGSTINFVHRRGKHLLIDLDNRKTLLVHLRMTGRFLLLPIDRELPKHSHAVFYFADESRLIFQDQRHFGLMKLLDTENLFKAKELEKLAPEPFSDEFDVPYLKRTLQSSKRSLKEFLLDQTKVCGLGNIYASEAMFLAKVNPQRAADKLPARKVPLLFEKIREVLAESIAHGSTLNVDPENIDGSYYGGDYEDHWRVYDREGLPCGICQTSIRRIVQGGRSTFFCPQCQN